PAFGNGTLGLRPPLGRVTLGLRPSPANGTLGLRPPLGHGTLGLRPSPANGTLGLRPSLGHGTLGLRPSLGRIMATNVADVGTVVADKGPRTGWATAVVRFCRKKPIGAAGGALMVIMLLTAVFADALATHDPIATDAGATLARPGSQHWLGTDHLGRDIYSRIVHGTRVSLIVGVLSTLLGSVFGGLIGLVSAYYGGKTDLITQRVLDILQGL